MEVAWLRNEQRATEEHVAAMWRRVQDTERRPKQMLSILLRVVGDPASSSRSSSKAASGRRSRGDFSSAMTARGRRLSTNAATTRAEATLCRAAWTCTCGGSGFGGV
ncbi:hypothetical protein ZWY2020_040774 [Hordeum vulgare]|nr:hypothetical protein ZWY2020_040774 [Hordeum vulgare]